MATAPSLPLQSPPLNSTPSTASNASTLEFGGIDLWFEVFRLRFGQAEGAWTADGGQEEDVDGPPAHGFNDAMVEQVQHTEGIESSAEGNGHRESEA
ncbi:hypothetical protein AKJ16_DCAP11369 [Drosera capensis]